MNKIITDCVVKLLPIIDSENEFQWLIPVDKLWLDSSKKFVYEISGANILRRLSFPYRANYFGKMYLVNTLEEGKIDDWDGDVYSSKSIARQEKLKKII